MKELNKIFKPKSKYKIWWLKTKPIIEDLDIIIIGNIIRFIIIFLEKLNIKLYDN